MTPSPHSHFSLSGLTGLGKQHAKLELRTVVRLVKTEQVGTHVALDKAELASQLGELRDGLKERDIGEVRQKV